MIANTIIAMAAHTANSFLGDIRSAISVTLIAEINSRRFPLTSDCLQQCINKTTEKGLEDPSVLYSVLFYHMACGYTKMTHKKTAQFLPTCRFLKISLFLFFYRIGYMYTFQSKISGKGHVFPVPIIIRQIHFHYMHT